MQFMKMSWYDLCLSKYSDETENDELRFCAAHNLSLNKGTEYFTELNLKFVCFRT